MDTRAAIVQGRSDLRRAQRLAERRRDGPQTDGAEKRHDPLRTFAHDQRDAVAALQSQILQVGLHSQYYSTVLTEHTIDLIYP
jgi:hypothetical protein